MQKYLFVISGCSSGIGFALCDHFSQQGHRVLAGYRKESDKDKLIQMGNVTPVKLDVTLKDDIERIGQKLNEIWNKDEKVCLINNAGIAKGGAVETTPIETYRNVFEVNLFGAIALTQVCLPLIRETKGRIVNISSISGLFASRFMSPYSTSKFALEALADSLRQEVSSFGVKVININPGFIDTPIWDKTEQNKEEMISDHPVYKPIVQEFGEVLGKKLKKTLISVDSVVRAVDDAMTSSSPKPNIIIGRFSIRLLMKMIPFLPKTLVVKITRG